MKTARIPVSQLVPNMIVASSIYTFNNQLLIEAGTRLSDKIITRLKFYSIDLVRISVDDDAPDVLPEAPLKKDLYLETIKETKEYKQFNQSLMTMTSNIKDTMEQIIENSKAPDVYALYDGVNEIISHSRNGLHIFDMLHCMRGFDDQTYVHSVNVAIICKVIGSWMNFTPRDLETVTICGLLHDIGKVTIPQDIISKPAKLTQDEYSAVQEHALRGYNILRPLDMNIHIKMAAMLHHERCDGSGYPMGLHSDQIDKFAKIVMIADVYDAMTSARVYRGPLCPFEVISTFENEGLTKYDPKYMMTFLDHLTQLYLHSTVRLSDGAVGQIILMNRNSLSKPVIKVGTDFVDLSNQNDLFISAII